MQSSDGFTVTILNGASLSGAIDLGMYRLSRVVMPAAWTAADLTVQASHDGVTYSNLYDSANTEYLIKAAAAREIVVPNADFLGIRYLKLRSGTSGSAVNQGADRIITLVGTPSGR